MTDPSPRPRGLLADDQSAAERPERLAVPLGEVPLPIEPEASLAGRLEAVEVIGALRRALVTENPLGAKQQQLVHFGQLVVLGERESAGVHGAAARRAGATPAELVGVVETALMTAGLPAYSLGLSALAELLRD